MIIRCALLIIGLTCVLISGRDALADHRTAPLPEIDPEGQWHVIRTVGASGTDGCIGSPETPLCAVETILACFLRQETELCKIAFWPSDPRPRLPRAIAQSYLKYRIVAARPTRARDLPENLPGGAVGLTSRPGDILLQIRYQFCFGDGATCGRIVGPPTYFYMRKAENRWYAETWFTQKY